MPNVAKLNLVLQHQQIKSPRELLPGKLKKQQGLNQGDSTVGPWEFQDMSVNKQSPRQ